MFKRTFAAIILLAATIMVSVQADAAKSDKWIIYWYVCGTDIESSHIKFKPGTDLMSDDPNAMILADPEHYPGCLTRSIREMEKATLSPNVKIFMQAGGTYIWGHEKLRYNNAKIQTGLTYNNLIGKGVAFYSEWNLVKNLKPMMVRHGKLGRYVFDKTHRNWNPREQLPITGDPNTKTDMGSQAGLVDFLQAAQKFEREKYPDGNVRRVLIFVDHGVTYAGGLHGVCKDAYTGNSLSLKEIHDAFAEVKDGWATPDEKAFEVVAFDACNMSAYETAMAVKDAANYMVASQEETNIYVGFGYTELLNELSKNPSMSGKELGKVICKTYWDDSKVVDKELNQDANTILTSSLIDLAEDKMSALETAYANFGDEALKVAKQHSSYEEFVQVITKFKKAASGAEKYPSEPAATHFKDYSDPKFVDLKGFAQNAKQSFPELKSVGDELIAAINNAVLYQKRGKSLDRGGGISVYYPFNLINDGENIAAYQNVTKQNGLAPQTQSKLYNFLYDNTVSDLQQVEVLVLNPQTGKPIRDDKGNFLTESKWQIPQGSRFDLSALSDEEISVNENKKTALLKISEEKRAGLEDVRCQLIYIKPYVDNEGTEKLQGLFLGGDSGMRENWNEGTFESTFNGKWVMFEGKPVFIHVVSDATRKNKNGKKIGGTELCAIPVLLNGQMRNVFVSCRYPAEKFTIIGVPPMSDGSGIPSGTLDSFKKGDVVTPLYLTFNVSEDDINFDEQARAKFGRDFNSLTDEEQLKITANYFNLVPGSPITIGKNKPKVELGILPNGNYAYLFEFVNPVDNKKTFTKQGVVFKLKDGNVVGVKHVEDLEDFSDLEDFDAQ